MKPHYTTPTSKDACTDSKEITDYNLVGNMLHDYINTTRSDVILSTRPHDDDDDLHLAGYDVPSTKLLLRCRLSLANARGCYGFGLGILLQ